MFFTALEPFVLDKMVKEIPQGFLDEYVSYHQDTQKDMI